MAHRGSVITIHPLHHRSPLHLRTTISRTRCRNNIQSRNLWWWGRQGNEWTTSFDEGLEERIRRHQRIMRHRYSKALRRKELWDREINQNSSWPWRMSDRWLKVRPTDMHDLSSNKEQKPNLGTPEIPKQPESSPWGTFDKFDRDFDSFRQTFSRAVNRDSHDTPFGRHLRSPPSANNSSWTSFSWIFDPVQTKPGVSVDSGKTDVHSSSTNTAVAQTGTIASISQATTPHTATEIEYEFDPISMKKVPKKNQAQVSEPSSKHKTLFDTLFGEHGAPIPVKPYNPPKVYGYGEGSKPDLAVKTSSQSTTTAKPGFESSRKRELQSLMACTLGNSIDTAAEYGGKYRAPNDPVPIGEPPTKRARDATQPADEAPLFSGTTYEAKSDKITKDAQSKSEWLKREGFKNETEAPTVTTSASKEAVEIPVKKFERRIEPTLDRLSTKAVSSAPSKLQPALDRQSPRVGSPPKTQVEELQTKHQRSRQYDVSEPIEDVDFLRASDVRAATKSARVTKQQVEISKQADRKKLEADYATRSQDLNEVNDYPDAFSSAKEKLNSSLSTVWKHVDQYPDGIVARTMRTIGLEAKAKSSVVTEARSSMSGETLDPKSRLSETHISVENVSLKRPHKPLTTFTPSVPNFEIENQYRLKDIKDEIKPDGAKEAALASSIKAIYETDYGKIDTEHRQGVLPQDGTQVQSRTITSNKPHPLQSATVKEGIPRNLVIENHTQNFEPKFASIIDGVKEVRRELFAISQHYRALRFHRSQPVWSMGEAIEDQAPSSSKPQMESQQSSKPKPVDLSTTQDNKAQVISGSSDEAAKAKIQEPVFTASGSPVWNDEQPPPISELRQPDFHSRFVTLKYNKKSDSVEVSGTDEPVTLATSTVVNPVSILSKLNHAPLFLKHFPSLEKANYEMIRGGSDSLLFQRADMLNASEATDKLNDEANKAFSTRIEDGSFSISNSSRYAATVLDRIPSETVPAPGPAAPTAPMPVIPKSRPGPASSPKIRRQEQVFSGQKRQTPAQEAAAPQTFENEPASRPSSSAFELHEKDNINWNMNRSTQPGIFKRLARGLRRVILTALAMGGIAYTIGVVAEGLGAQEQVKQGVDTEAGPRKRIVMTGQRPGIFSTESSR